MWNLHISAKNWNKGEISHGWLTPDTGRWRCTAACLHLLIYYTSLCSSSYISFFMWSSPILSTLMFVLLRMYNRVRNSGSPVARGYQICCRATTIGDGSSPVVYHRIWVTDGLIISAGQVSETTQWLPLGWNNCIQLTTSKTSLEQWGQCQ